MSNSKKDKVNIINKLLNEVLDEREEINKEIDELKRIITVMTHHKGAVKESEELWAPVVKSYFNKINSLGN